VGSEIVWAGAEKKAIEMAADYFLQLENFHLRKCLRNKLAAALSGAALEEKQDGKLAAAGKAVCGRGGRADGDSWRRQRFSICAALARGTGARWSRDFRARKNRKLCTWTSFLSIWTRCGGKLMR